MKLRGNGRTVKRKSLKVRFFLLFFFTLIRTKESLEANAAKKKEKKINFFEKAVLLLRKTKNEPHF